MNGKTVINHIGACINKIKSLSCIKTGGDLIAWPVQKGVNIQKLGLVSWKFCRLEICNKLCITKKGVHVGEPLQNYQNSRQCVKQQQII